VGKQREEDEIDDEARIDDGDERETADAPSDGTINAGYDDEQNGLPGRRVGLHLSPAVQQDERLSRRLEQIVRSQDQKDGQPQHGCAEGLLGLHLGERAQERSEQVALGSRVGDHGNIPARPIPTPSR
jgi:hypothetical protein